MPYILLFFLGIIMLVLLTRKMTNENAKPLMHLLGWLAFILCVLSGIYFAVTGRIGFVAALFIIIMWFWGKAIQQRYNHFFHKKQAQKISRKKPK